MQASPFQVQAFVTSFTGEQEQFAHASSYHNLRRTLRLAHDLAGGIPGAYVSIRYKGRRIAELETNHRGELTEADVLAEGPRAILVTPLNVHGPIFSEGV